MKVMKGPHRGMVVFAVVAEEVVVGVLTPSVRKGKMRVEINNK